MGYRYPTRRLYGNAVSPEDINKGFVNARDNSIPRVLYVKKRVRLNIAGNDEAMPPSSGPPS